MHNRSKEFQAQLEVFRAEQQARYNAALKKAYFWVFFGVGFATAFGAMMAWGAM